MSSAFSVMVVCGVTLCAFVSAQSNLTIPEAVTRRGTNPYVTTRLNDFAPRPFEEVVDRADVIVRATLHDRSSYLSEDQRDLYTDYIVRPSLVLASSRDLGMRRPGSDHLVLRQWGGEIVLNGVQVSMTDSGFPLLPVNTPLLLLLQWNEKVRKYEIVGGCAGAFVVGSDNKVKRWLSPAAPDDTVSGTDVQAVQSRIRARRPARP